MEFNTRLILLFPIISGIMWSSGGVFTRILHNYGFENISIFSTRVILATIILFFVLLVFDRGSLKINIKDIWLFVGCGLIGTLLLNICYNEAAFTVSLSLASLLLGLAPIFALFISAIIFKEKITSIKIICLIIALFGCLLVSGILENSGFNSSLHGLIFGFASALFWALYGIFSKLATNKGYSSSTIIFYSFLLNTIVLTPFTDWNLFSDFIISNPSTNILITFVHSIFTSILPYFLFSIALEYMDNGQATLLCSGAEPTSATIWGALLFSEYPSILNLLGIIITIFALSLLTYSSNKE